uniref:Cilia- and flagella-associated protein 157 n=1 Tax=Amphora coffeiformis TaxID=265554 RepID=A0A7S3L8N7_9STRA|mmetsp:Transcript_5108/g.9771  ORF Transcript_5108/g.9771 Transcript_5108/m.9771 type:complete len:238 (-) Transcript_5108:1355-2068(-)|eukprot:scaffold8029_cov170-Amphora_coffeaeformis.AAC.2
METVTMEKEHTEFMIEQVNKDPTFAAQLVGDLLKIKDENEHLRDQVAALKQMEIEAQQALRQARGISTYLKGKQGELQKHEKESQLALRQANGISTYLKSKNESLENRLKDAERVEMEAQQALRQARGVSAYLKSKNASLEKKLAASKTEKSAQTALRQARQASLTIRSSITADNLVPPEEKALLQVEPNEHILIASSDVESEDHETDYVPNEGSLSINDVVGLFGLVIVGLVVAAK